MANYVNEIDMTTLENVIMNHHFSMKTLKNGIKNFQLITDPAQLHTPNGSLSPNDIYLHAPEQSIISIDVAGQATGYPLANVDGHLFAITGNMPAGGNKKKATPMLVAWMPLSDSSDLYLSTYNGNGAQHIWRKISKNYEDRGEIKNANQDVTCYYRLIQGRFLEFSIDTTNVAYPTQTDVFQLPYQVLENRNIHFPATLWGNNGVPTGMNGVRIMVNGTVQLICVDKYVHVHGMFAVK